MSDQSTRIVEWLIVRYLYPAPERERPYASPNAWTDSPDQTTSTIHAYTGRTL